MIYNLIDKSSFFRPLREHGERLATMSPAILSTKLLLGKQLTMFIQRLQSLTRDYMHNLTLFEYILYSPRFQPRHAALARHPPPLSQNTTLLVVQALLAQDQLLEPESPWIATPDT
jgi:hypothetical protein